MRRLVAVAVAIAIGGLSSSFAVCVSTCPDEAARQTATHSCHEQGHGLRITNADQPCSHAPVLSAVGEFSRDLRPAVTPLLPIPGTALLVTRADRPTASIRPPTVSLISSPVLRI